MTATIACPICETFYVEAPDCERCPECKRTWWQAYMESKAESETERVLLQAAIAAKEALDGEDHK